MRTSAISPLIAKWQVVTVLVTFLNNAKTIACFVVNITMIFVLGMDSLQNVNEICYSTLYFIHKNKKHVPYMKQKEPLSKTYFRAQ